MHKFLVFFLIASSAALAATTQVTQTVRNPDGSLANGIVNITLSGACTDAGGDYVGTARPITIAFRQGSFSVNLVPNDTCTPCTFYEVSWQLAGNTIWRETWYVPTSSNPVSVGSVITTTACGQTAGLEWEQEPGTWAGTSGTWASQ